MNFARIKDRIIELKSDNLDDLISESIEWIKNNQLNLNFNDHLKVTIVFEGETIAYCGHKNDKLRNHERSKIINENSILTNYQIYYYKRPSFNYHNYNYDDIQINYTDDNKFFGYIISSYKYKLFGIINVQFTLEKDIYDGFYYKQCYLIATNAECIGSIFPDSKGDLIEYYEIFSKDINIFNDMKFSNFKSLKMMYELSDIFRKNFNNLDNRLKIIKISKVITNYNYKFLFDNKVSTEDLLRLLNTNNLMDIVETICYDDDTILILHHCEKPLLQLCIDFIENNEELISKAYNDSYAYTANNWFGEVCLLTNFSIKNVMRLFDIKYKNSFESTGEINVLELNKLSILCYIFKECRTEFENRLAKNKDNINMDVLKLFYFSDYYSYKDKIKEFDLSIEDYEILFKNIINSYITFDFIEIIKNNDYTNKLINYFKDNLDNDKLCLFVSSFMKTIECDFTIANDKDNPQLVQDLKLLITECYNKFSNSNEDIYRLFNFILPKYHEDETCFGYSYSKSYFNEFGLRSFCSELLFKHINKIKEFNILYYDMFTRMDCKLLFRKFEYSKENMKYIQKKIFGNEIGL